MVELGQLGRCAGEGVVVEDDPVGAVEFGFVACWARRAARSPSRSLSWVRMTSGCSGSDMAGTILKV